MYSCGCLHGGAAHDDVEALGVLSVLPEAVEVAVARRESNHSLSCPAESRAKRAETAREELRRGSRRVSRLVSARKWPHASPGVP